MTDIEIQICGSSSRLLMGALNSNLYADRYPDKAAKGVKDAEACARFLNANGRKVEMEVIEVDGRRRVRTLTVDGKTWVRGGAFVQDPAER